MARNGPPQAIDQRRVLVIIGALLLGMLLAALDQTIVATALPTIAGDLHGLSHLSWVITAYLLASTVSTPLWGKLGDMYGRKRFFQASIVIFLVGSALSGLAHSMVELIAFRAVQGLGGGGLIVCAPTISPPPPSPCTARNAINSTIECASPDSAEPTKKITIEAWKNLFRPYMSPSLPHNGVDTVEASRYAVITHDRCDNPCRSPAIVGSAVATIVWSSAASNIPSSNAPMITSTRRCAKTGGGPPPATPAPDPAVTGSSPRLQRRSSTPPRRALQHLTMIKPIVTRPPAPPASGQARRPDLAGARRCLTLPASPPCEGVPRG